MPFLIKYLSTDHYFIIHCHPRRLMLLKSSLLCTPGLPSLPSLSPSPPVKVSSRSHRYLLFPCTRYILPTDQDKILQQNTLSEYYVQLYPEDLGQSNVKMHLVTVTCPALFLLPSTNRFPHRLVLAPLAPWINPRPSSPWFQLTGPAAAGSISCLSPPDLCQ